MNTLAQVTQTLPGAHLQAAEKYISAQLADATRRAYRSDARVFAEWCEARQLQPVPATPETVAEFLADQADDGIKPATLRRRIAAIRFAHQAAGLDSPTSSMTVSATLKGICNRVGVKPNRKAPATAPRLREMIQHCPDSLIGKRDRALLLLGFAGAFRRSELVGLTMADLEETAQGLRVTIRRSKTDQQGAGQTLAILRGDVHCPVQALQAWLQAAGISEGYLFRPIGKGGRISPNPLSTKSVAQIIKAHAGRAGLKEADYAGHSLRAGFLTSAAENGANLFKLMEVSRHKSVETVRGYVRNADLFKGHAGAGLL